MKLKTPESTNQCEGELRVERYKITNKSPSISPFHPHNYEKIVNTFKEPTDYNTGEHVFTEEVHKVGHRQIKYKSHQINTIP